MIAIRGIQAWNWRNRFADHPVTTVDLELDAAAAWRSDQLSPDALAAMGDRFAGVRAGFGGLAGAGLLATLCLWAQREKYDLPAAAAAAAAQSQFWFAAVDPFYASATAGFAVAFVNGLVERPQITAAEITQGISQFIDRCEGVAVDQSTRAMAAMANTRGIPWFRIHQGFPDLQFGHGRNQRRMRETIHSDESWLASSYARNKALSLAMLAGAGLPVGAVATADSPEQAVSVATAMGFPVVLKLGDRGKGIGVIVGLTTPQAVHLAARTLLQAARQIVVQSFLPGDDHRLLVVSGRLVAAARREPASVVGDGQRSIAQLIELANRDPRRGTGFQKLMNTIEIDDELRRVVAIQGVTLATVPGVGVQIRLRLTANISTGGGGFDVTDTLHPDNAWLAERAASILGLSVAGVDLLSPDITRSWREVGGGICEVNAAVGLRPHWLANPSRDVVGPILDALFPSGGDGRIPTALITGSNGKTTTTRMLDHILRAAGHVVGSATTDGVTINGRIVIEGDVAGPDGAAIVLRDPSVTAAVLETARGGLVKSGVGLDRCNVAALLNVDHEQVGIDGIETLDDMVRLKRKVVETARDAFIFNAENPRSYAVSRDFPAGRTILFALDAATKAARAHLEAGGTLVTLADVGGQETIVIRTREGETKVLASAAIPATFDGAVRHNVANALAAVALAHGMTVPVETIAAGLSGFTPSLEHSQGRFNFIDGFPTRVLFDYADNPAAITALVKAVEPFAVVGRRICMVTSPGDRPDGQIDDCARAVAHHFDHYIGYETVAWRRGRAPGEIAHRLTDALLAAGVPEDRVTTASTQKSALEAAVDLVAPEDLLIILGTEIRFALPQLRAAFAQVDSGGRPAEWQVVTA